MATQYKCTNTTNGDSLVTNQKGFEGLIASHVHLMEDAMASLQTTLILGQMQNEGVWEPKGRALRVEKTNLPFNETVQQGA
jgi:hypothetical protein